MTTLQIWDFRTVFEDIRDIGSLRIVDQVIHAEISLHEARLVQLKEISGAIHERIGAMGDQPKG